MKIKITEPETPSDWIELIEHSCADLPTVEIRSRFDGRATGIPALEVYARQEG